LIVYDEYSSEQKKLIIDCIYSNDYSIFSFGLRHSILSMNPIILLELLFSLIEEGKVEFIEKLISHCGIDCRDYNGWTLLHHIFYQNRIDIFNYLKNIQQIQPIIKQLLISKSNQQKTPLHVWPTSFENISKLVLSINSNSNTNINNQSSSKGTIQSIHSFILIFF
jgi:ankyrin repeat protein